MFLNEMKFVDLSVLRLWNCETFGRVRSRYYSDASLFYKETTLQKTVILADWSWSRSAFPSLKPQARGQQQLTKKVSQMERKKIINIALSPFSWLQTLTAEAWSQLFQLQSLLLSYYFQSWPQRPQLRIPGSSHHPSPAKEPFHPSPSCRGLWTSSPPSRGQTTRRAAKPATGRTRIAWRIAWPDKTGWTPRTRPNILHIVWAWKSGKIEPIWCKQKAIAPRILRHCNCEMFGREADEAVHLEKKPTRTCFRMYSFLSTFFVSLVFKKRFFELFNVQKKGLPHTIPFSSCNSAQLAHLRFWSLKIGWLIDCYGV